MATAVAGISSLGVKFGYAVSTDGSKPTSFNWLERCNDIPEYSVTPETIDASALEDYVERKVAGRATTSDNLPVVFNNTDTVRKQLEKCIADYKAMNGEERMWFEVWNPNSVDGYYMVAQPPEVLPFGGASQNSVQTITFPLTVEDLKGYLTGVEPTEMTV